MLEALYIHAPTAFVYILLPAFHIHPVPPAYTGMIDENYGYKFGVLEYRSVRFETERLETGNYQGNAVVNYTSADVPYTRIIEHTSDNFLYFS